MRRISFVCAAFLLAAATALAEDDARSIPLILHPTAAPAPALKYALLPELRDSLPGNAVTRYRQAIKIMKQDAPPQRDWNPAMDQWMAVPLKDFPREEVGKFLKQCETTLQEVDAGARSEDCEWGLTEVLRKYGIAAPLADVQEMRAFARLLQLRIRYEIAEGRFDKAVRSLRTGYAMGRHVADAPTLICALVGLAISGIMDKRLEEFVQQPDAPNLYWALADLPRPFIDLRKPMQGERVGIYSTFPGMTEMAADLNAKPFTPEQVKKIVKLLDEINPEPNQIIQEGNKAILALRLAARHEAAKKILIEQGRPKELVDAMPHVQVGLLVALRQYDQLFDEYMKWQSFPFWEAQAGFVKAEARQKGILDDVNGPALPLARLLLPGVTKIFASRTRIDRQIAALRCVEAIRLYAAAHDGKLPASLDEIKDVPVPFDPVTGKPFSYRLAGDRAFFRCEPFPGQPPTNANSPTYEITIQR